MGLRLEIDPGSQMADLPAELPRDQLVSVLGNLIDNALEATLHKAGNGGRVSLSMTDLGRELIFEVEDEGLEFPGRIGPGFSSVASAPKVRNTGSACTWFSSLSIAGEAL